MPWADPGAVAFHGLDLYSLYNSIRSVLHYLDEVDPEWLRVARQRYGCLTPWQADPATYGHAALTGTYGACEARSSPCSRSSGNIDCDYAERDGERFLDVVQNARLVANAERYYRIMYYGSRASWNLRDEHMFATLKTLLAFYGPAVRRSCGRTTRMSAIAATEMPSRGEHNIGQLCRQEFGDAAYLVGFGTNSGTVAAATDWDGPMEIKTVRRRCPKSYRGGVPRHPSPPLHLGAARPPRRAVLTADAAALATGDRRYLPAGDGARESLFPGGAAAAIR